MNLKAYNPGNFFKHTFCAFQKQELNDLASLEVHFKSKTGSQYVYNAQGVYRYSNHWGRVANCRWKLLSKEKLKSQDYYVGYARWTDFYPLNEAEKQFYISVDFKQKTTDFHHKATNDRAFLFFAEAAQKKVTQIRKLFLDDKWANYFEEDVDVLREKIITAYINSNKTLQQLKLELQE
ncbi:hypothetical protein GCM10011416_01890 [Polaribacter pacificus]|uniref:Uncharacterized protein n=1 Tax=Polaribacter pacificus TaxID=1775173 RepID=A0A917MB96_9FLAO|nr:hypothetical protein [Polaribacter pacificus]GGG89102.1 hypothetical protein GCM10011416_01890 [Polaribacter pacificus]